MFIYHIILIFIVNKKLIAYFTQTFNFGYPNIIIKSGTNNPKTDRLTT